LAWPAISSVAAGPPPPRRPDPPEQRSAPGSPGQIASGCRPRLLLGLVRLLVAENAFSAPSDLIGHPVGLLVKATTGPLVNLFLTLGRVHRHRPEPLGQLQAVAGQVDAVSLGDPEGGGHGQGAQPDGPAAQYQHPPRRGRAGPAQGVPGRAEQVEQGGGLAGPDPRVDRHEAAGPHHLVVGEPAGGVEPVHPAAVEADVGPAAAAGRAGAAEVDQVDDAAGAGTGPVDTGTGLDHLAGGLVPGGDRRTRLQGVAVAAAQGAGLDPDQQLPWSR
jgi:hypothetical protein